MGKSICVIMCGLPGVGKTHMRPKVRRDMIALGADDRYICVVSSDDFLAARGITHQLNYNESFARFMKEADQDFWDRLSYVSERGAPIIVDRTCLTIKSRKRIMEHVEKSAPGEYIFICVLVMCGKEIHDTRLSNRSKTEGKSIPKNVLETMETSFQSPSHSEGFTYIWNYLNNMSAEENLLTLP